MVQLDNTITIVSGLPRSGTSMMMAMLQEGGVPAWEDGKRVADPSNPKGYYELQRVKNLREDNTWVGQARQRVIKVISHLLQELPNNYQYRIVFMLRPLKEILMSQEAMLKRLGKYDSSVDSDILERKFLSHLSEVKKWLSQKTNMDVIYMSHSDIMAHAQPAVQSLNRFFGGTLDEKKMLSVIDPLLYRQKSVGCKTQERP